MDVPMAWWCGLFLFAFLSSRVLCLPPPSRSAWLRGGSTASVVAQADSNSASSHTNTTEALIARFDAATNGEAILLLAEEIPAIRRSLDKAMRIVIADGADATMAAHAIQRLANVTVSTSPAQRKNAKYWIPSALDRRFEQLTEIVEIRAAHLPLQTLARYCWGLSLLKIADEEQVDVIFEEYKARLQSASNSTPPGGTNAISNEELGTMLWTVGCVRDTYRWSREPLFSNLTAALLARVDHDLANLDVRILIRILWTLSLHTPVSDNDSTTQLLAKHVLASLVGRLSVLSDKNIISVISSAAKLNLHVTEMPTVECLLQRLLPEVERTSGSDLASAAEAFSTIYSQLSGQAKSDTSNAAASIVQLVSKASIGLISAAGKQRKSSLPVGCIAELVHLAVLIDVVDDRTILESGLRQVEALLANNVTIAPNDASLLLEACALLTWTIRREKGFHTSQRDVNATSSLGIFLSAQRLAGRMSAVCSTYEKELSSSALLSSSWACACYCRPCSKLLNLMNKEVQNNSFALLANCDANSLAKLAVVVASDDKLDSTFRGRPSTFDTKVINTLLPLVIDKLMEISPSGLQVSVFVAIAELGAEQIPTTHTHTLLASDLEKLRTSSLIRFLWAAGRLPEGLISNATFASAQSILLGRQIDIGDGTGRFSTSTGHNSEFMLLARLLVEARKPSGRQDVSFIDVVLKNVLKAMAAFLPEEGEGGSGSEVSVDGANSDGDAPKKVGAAPLNEASAKAVDLVALSEIVSALIELKVYNAELVRQCLRCVDIEVASRTKHKDESSAACRRLFDLGKLEGLLAIYRSTAGAELLQKKANARGFRLFG